VNRTQRALHRMTEGLISPGVTHDVSKRLHSAAAHGELARVAAHWCVVALAAKRREMVATVMLAAILCAMTGVVVVLSAAKGHTSILWMLHGTSLIGLRS